jgi:plastocyanin
MADRRVNNKNRSAGPEKNRSKTHSGPDVAVLVIISCVIKRRRMKKIILTGLLAVAVITLSLLSCSKDDETTNNQPPEVSMDPGPFTPATLNVRTGTTVTWTNNSSDLHTVVSTNGEGFDSGDMIPGATFNHKFLVAGTYSYGCTYHRGATGVVIVTD